MIWVIEHFGEGPTGAIIRADTASEAEAIFRDLLEGYEGCYHNTGRQRVRALPEDQAVIHVELRQVGLPE